MEFPSSAVSVVALIALVVCVAEGLSYLLVASHHRFKRLVVDIERSSKELERLRQGQASSSSKKREKTVDSQLTMATRDYWNSKMQMHAIMGVLVYGTFWYLSSSLKGKVVAKLPFVPFAQLRHLTHRSLDKTEPVDWTDCSFFLIFALAAACLKINISKLCGSEPSRAFAKHTNVENTFERFKNLTAAGR